MKRIPGWDEYFMKIAKQASTRSKDRSTKLGAVLVGKGNNLLSVGYNSFPRGINDDVEARHERPAKYLYTEHAERNAIYNAARHGVSTIGATLYLYSSGFPCADCARAIIQSGVAAVVTMEGKFKGKGNIWNDSCRAGEEMLREAGIDIVVLDKKFRRKSR